MPRHRFWLASGATVAACLIVLLAAPLGVVAQTTSAGSPALPQSDDLTLLVQHYIRRFSRELGKEVQGVAPQTLDLLRQYAWPGNVRELQSALKQALLQATGAILVPDFLPAALLNAWHLHIAGCLIVRRASTEHPTVQLRNPIT